MLRREKQRKEERQSGRERMGDRISRKVSDQRERERIEGTEIEREKRCVSERVELMAGKVLGELCKERENYYIILLFTYL